MLCAGLALALGTLAGARAADMLEIHFEADKGETSVRIPMQPMALDRLLFAAPSFSPDPLAPEAVITEARVRRLGTVAGRAICEARLRVMGDYYSHVFMLLVEVTPGGYLPFYGQQYAQGVRVPRVISASFQPQRAALDVRVDYSGTGAHRTHDEITVGVTPEGKLDVFRRRR